MRFDLIYVMFKAAAKIFTAYGRLLGRPFIFVEIPNNMSESILDKSNQYWKFRLFFVGLILSFIGMSSGLYLRMQQRIFFWLVVASLIAAVVIFLRLVCLLNARIVMSNGFGFLLLKMILQEEWFGCSQRRIV
ncbi:hypothetical protein [Cellvibrio japonicus]|uniref:hypothetical protein n=1 Tax=Cellvibrio japonicus TaxID=155077 RepID=UPI0011D08561|nr:hypothetical protein [Cellvibrio japonicus]QEI11605.1 hypothetical protein FY117_04755 [Cellvibrio japonicus]QEI15179.1 hypothetical protein FY116_04755 [Cellvibrio japonicus]QEI18759.1 hypothetical protein FY115_04755 [Cellvibrio japonicus]